LSIPTVKRLQAKKTFHFAPNFVGFGLFGGK